jgi:hypothetical protein
MQKSKQRVTPACGGLTVARRRTACRLAPLCVFVGVTWGGASVAAARVDGDPVFIFVDPAADPPPTRAPIRASDATSCIKRTPGGSEQQDPRPQAEAGPEMQEPGASPAGAAAG